MAEEYYKNLFTFGHPTQLEDVLNSVDKVVINDIRDSLLQTYMAKEVRTILFQNAPIKGAKSRRDVPILLPKILEHCWTGCHLSHAISSSFRQEPSENELHSYTAYP